MAATKHWIERVRERIGVVDPEMLAEGIIWAIQNERDDIVEFVARVNRKGLRIFRFRVAENGRQFFALVDTEQMKCVTVMPPGFAVARYKNTQVDLKEIRT